MMTDADTLNGDRMAWLVRVLGGEAAGAETRPLTEDEFRLVEEGLARYNGDPVAALGQDVDADTAAYIRALPVGIRR